MGLIIELDEFRSDDDSRSGTMEERRRNRVGRVVVGVEGIEGVDGMLGMVSSPSVLS